MSFKAEYDKLNKQQEKAVDTLDGPVLVIAGPGTGKTQLLSMRVANILRKTDTDARNILCLTFTNKAAVNMRERLRDLTNNEARNVTVKTFHAFAAEVMSSYPEYFFSGANLSNAPESVQLDIMQSIIASLPKDNPYAAIFDGNYTMLKPALRGIGLAKEAGLTPDKLEALLTANLEYIDLIEPLLVEILSPSLSFKRLDLLQSAVGDVPKHNIDEHIRPLLSLSTIIQESLDHAIDQDQRIGKTTNTGKWKKQWVQTVDDVKGMHSQRKKNLKWLALAGIYKQYRTQLHHQSYYDYSDMLLEVIVQIEQNPELKSQVQERFEYVLIDEFQDSNAAQLRLAHLIADHHSAENKPNIMAVGDDDQSIYGFNGAELNNMLHFDRTYAKVDTIVLQENYRSTQAVLDAAETIIRQSEDRLVDRVKSISKDLRACNSTVRPGVIRHTVYQDSDHQLYSLAAEIEALKKKLPEQTVAVLARKHTSLIPLAAALNQRDVAMSYEKDQNILELDAIKQIIIIMEVVSAINTGDEQYISALLAKLIVHPMWQIPPETLWSLARQNRYNDQWLETMAEYDETKNISLWLQWLARQAAVQPLTILLEHCLGLRSAMSHTNPDEIFFTSPIQHYFIAHTTLNESYLQVLSAVRLLRSLVAEFQPETEPTIEDFLQYIKTMSSGSRVVSDQSVFVSGDNVVELLSVHKAKGLEFDTVYVIDTVEDHWKPTSQRDTPPANLSLQPPLESADDYARLMYVAATRAKSNLYFTSYNHTITGDEVLATPLIASIPVKQASLGTQPQQTAVLESALSWPRLSVQSERQLLQPILDSFTLNVSNLINFLDVSEGGPALFLERNILRLPGVKGPHMSHGTAVHAALEQAQKLINLGAFDFDTVIKSYEAALIRDNFPPQQLKNQVETGNQVLDRLFAHHRYLLQKGSIPELPIKDCLIGDARIGGTLDRVDFIDDHTIRIVDYKTGAPLRNFQTQDKTKRIKAWKHKLQLTFYALLAQHHPQLNNHSAVTAQMAYVEADLTKDITLDYQPSQEEIDYLAKLVRAVWQKIMTYELPDTSSYSNDIDGITAFQNDLINT